MAAEIENCGWIFKIQCPLQWDQLAETADPAIRTCGSCLQNVYLCETGEQGVAHAQLGHCVALVQHHKDDEDCCTLGALMPVDDE